MAYSLKFQMQLANSDQLLTGSLQLIKDSEIINEFIATSSLPRRQHQGSWGRKGGLIPPRLDYQVSIYPIDMFDIQGINGNFYSITPFEQNVNGVTRGDFGIHADWWKYGKGSKGTLGCIGIQSKNGMAAFDREMLNIKKLREDSQEDPILLQVIYS